MRRKNKTIPAAPAEASNMETKQATDNGRRVLQYISLGAYVVFITIIFLNWGGRISVGHGGASAFFAVSIPALILHHYLEFKLQRQRDAEGEETKKKDVY
jgi:hypothetical protein